MTGVASFGIRFHRTIDAAGRPVADPLPPVARDRDALVGLYRAMVLTRTFDAKAIALQRTGRLGTYPSCLGQEAVAVGVGAAMRADDVLLPYAREQGAQLLRGVTLEELFLFWGGDERGSDFAGPREDFPIAVPWAPTHRTRPASPSPSSCAGSRGSRSASPATAARRRATSTKR